MANREKGEVGFKALDQDWIMRFSSNALCEIEDATGKSALEMANGMSDAEKVKISDLRLMFWAGLTEHHEGVGLKQAGKIIDALGFNRAGDLLSEALVAAFPDEEAGEAAKGKPKPG